MLASIVYVTTSTNEEAQEIARSVVADRLAACANILGNISSIYLWQSEQCESSETALLLKTSPELITSLTKRITELHSYDCPCIVVLGVVGGNHDFIEWIKQETINKKPT